jgi:hypothetical protein
MTLRANEMTSVPEHAYERVHGHVELPPTPNPEPADAKDMNKTATKSHTTQHLDWLRAHERLLQRSVVNKTDVVSRDIPIVVSGEDLSLAELVAVAR